jgi:two-component system nitrogen regulation response regulator GlnG
MGHRDKKPLVLLVDDDAESCRALAELLSLEDFDPWPFDRVEAAWAVLDRGALDPDVAVVDVRMPGMNGIELLQQIKTRFPALPVLLISAFPDERLWRQGLGAGAADVFPKPIHGPSLVRVLHQILNPSAAVPRGDSENPGSPMAGAPPRREP